MFGTNASSRSCSKLEGRAARLTRMPILLDRHRLTTSSRLSGWTHSRKTIGDADSESGQVKSSDAVVHSAVGGDSSTLGPTIVSSPKVSMACCKYGQPGRRAPRAAACAERCCSTIPRLARAMSSSPVRYCHCMYFARSTLQTRLMSVSRDTRSLPRVRTASSTGISIAVYCRESSEHTTGGIRRVPR
eukprot:2220724-Rhodomonas_salina.1